jgi:16S rRNA processing protein RimM
LHITGRERIERVRFHRGQVLVKFFGREDASAAESLRGNYISVTRDQLIPLEQDNYYVFDLIGCEVFDTAGEFYGKLVEVLETGGNDVYVVKPANAPGVQKKRGDILLPAIKSVILEVDIERKRIVADFPEYI